MYVIVICCVIILRRSLNHEHNSNNNYKVKLILQVGGFHQNWYGWFNMEPK